MKTLLLIGALAFSLNLFGQTFPGVKDFKTHALNSTNYYSDLLNSGEIQSNKFSRKLSGIPVKNSIAFQRGLNPVYDSIYMWNWFEGATEWNLDYRITDIVYNASDLPLTYTAQLWDGNAWENEYQYVLTYDASDNILIESEKVWTGSAWLNTYQYVYTFDSNHNPTSETFQVWDNGAWHNDNRYTYTYDVNNNRLTELYEIWNVVTWENNNLYTYTFDQNNNLLSQLYQYWNFVLWVKGDSIAFTYDDENNQLSALGLTWDGSTWSNSFQYINTFDANNNKVSDLSQNWDGTEWVNSSWTLFGYDGSNRLISQHYNSWTGFSWTNEQMLLFEYDQNNNVTRFEFQTWRDQSWYTVFVNTSAFNEDNFLIDETSKYYDSTGVNLAFGDSTHYFLRTTVAVNEIDDELDGISVYPNPSNGVFTISSEAAIGDIEIFNSIGEKIYAGGPNGPLKSHEVSLSEVGPGIYLVLLHDGVNYWSKKVVIGNNRQ